jgi:hypothetical protein
VERDDPQEEREAEIRAVADQLDRQGDEMEERGERLESEVDRVREEIQRKKESSEVPGLQDSDSQPEGTPPGDAAGGAPRTEEDE